MRILIVGDSVAFHRSRAGQTLDQAWPWQLRLAVPGSDVWVRSKPAALVGEVLEQVELIGPSLNLFDLVIVQSGIVDSCPRPMPHAVYNLLRSLGGMRLGKLINQQYPRLLKLYRRSWTSEVSYREHLRRIVARVREASPETLVLFVPIAPVCKGLARMADGSPAAAERYNAIIESVVEASGTNVAALVADFRSDCREDHMLDDGHHLTAEGHQLLARSIARFIATAFDRVRATPLRNAA